MIGADMNAKLKKPGSITEDGIDSCIFGSDGATTVLEGAGVQDNSHLLQDLLISTKHSTHKHFSGSNQKIKSPAKLHKEARTEPPPFTKGRSDVIVYIVAPRRWHNSVRNVYTDLFAGIDSDHYPLTADIKI